MAVLSFWFAFELMEEPGLRKAERPPAGERPEAPAEADGPPGVRGEPLAPLRGGPEAESLPSAEGAASPGDTAAMAALRGLGPDSAVSGVVADERGAPLPGVAIHAEVLRSEGEAALHEGAPVASTTSDAEGGFRLAGFLRAGESYVLIARHPGFAPAAVSPVDPLVPGTLFRRIVLVPGGRVEGRVVDPSNAGVPGAEVAACVVGRTLRDGGVPVGFCATDGDGAFAIENLPPGPFILKASAPGLSSGLSSGLVLDGSETIRGVRIELQPAASLFARVVSDSDGRPLPGLVVAARPLGASGSVAAAESDLPSAVSDHAGFVRISGASPGMHVLAVRGLPARFAQPVNGIAGAEPAREEDWPAIRVSTRGMVSGRVVDRETGEPVRRFSVAALREGMPSLAARASGRSFDREDGTFELYGAGEDEPARASIPAPGKPWKILVEAPGYAPLEYGPVFLSTRRDVPGLQLAVARGAVLSGVVLDSAGKGVQDASVRLIRMDAADWNDGGSFAAAVQMRRSLSDGSFVLPGVGSGTYRLQVDHDHMEFLETDSFKVSGAGTVDLAPVRLAAGCAIEGHVRDLEGRPDPGAIVLLAHETGEFSSTYPTDGEGFFRAGRLTPGAYRVAVIQRRGRLLPEGRPGAVRIRLAAGRTERVNLEEQRP